MNPIIQDTIVSNLTLIGSWVGAIAMFIRTAFLSRRLKRAQVTSTEIEAVRAALVTLKVAYDNTISTFNDQTSIIQENNRILLEQIGQITRSNEKLCRYIDKLRKAIEDIDKGALDTRIKELQRLAAEYPELETQVKSNLKIN